ncbi:MAG TPA: choice-of-anchor L domain-containing protein, partial [Acidimicrobiia bacterium]|nr:choice-of-anchor L domain-containing protein [Acidimicrobiia bacterium]
MESAGIVLTSEAATSTETSDAPPPDTSGSSGEPGNAELVTLALESDGGEAVEILSVDNAEMAPQMELAVAELTEDEAPSDVSVALLPGLVTSSDTAENVVAVLVGTGITFENINYVGAEDAIGQFSGGTGIIGFESGVILGSGNINNVVGPNEVDDDTTAHGEPGDADLDAIVDGGTQDAAVLTFDFVPSGNTVQFEYVFASEEYNEFVGSQFNDVFAFFINGSNCATVEGARVSVNTINGESNSSFYRNNDLQDGGGSIDTEMDGLTVV